MILSFKKQFKQPILDGTKIHTIREDQHNRWWPGYIIHFACGVRTKLYECFKIGKCTRTQEIFMTYDWMLHISIDDRELYHPEKELLAKNDGFATYAEFQQWFYEAIKANPKDHFKGKIIHWTDFKY
jgi:hypothetical protein